jgi:hypothetical protein
MTPEQIDAAEWYVQQEREFAAAMRLLSDAVNGVAWSDETGEPISVDEAAERAVFQWEVIT